MGAILSNIASILDFDAAEWCVIVAQALTALALFSSMAPPSALPNESEVSSIPFPSKPEHEPEPVAEKSPKLDRVTSRRRPRSKSFPITTRRHRVAPEPKPKPKPKPAPKPEPKNAVETYEEWQDVIRRTLGNFTITLRSPHPSHVPPYPPPQPVYWPDDSKAPLPPFSLNPFKHCRRLSLPTWKLQQPGTRRGLAEDGGHEGVYESKRLKMGRRKTDPWSWHYAPKFELVDGIEWTSPPRDPPANTDLSGIELGSIGREDYRVEWRVAKGFELFNGSNMKRERDGLGFEIGGSRRRLRNAPPTSGPHFPFEPRNLARRMVFRAFADVGPEVPRPKFLPASVVLHHRRTRIVKFYGEGESRYPSNQVLRDDFHRSGACKCCPGLTMPVPVLEGMGREVVRVEPSDEGGPSSASEDSSSQDCSDDAKSALSDSETVTVQLGPGTGGNVLVKVSRRERLRKWVGKRLGGWAKTSTEV